MNKSTSYATMQRNTIKYMMGYINEYEQVRRKEHAEYKTVIIDIFLNLTHKSSVLLFYAETHFFIYCCNEGSP